MKERTKLLLIILVFLACYYVPWSHPTIRQAGLEAFMMLQEYAREHVLTCLIPAFLCRSDRSFCITGLGINSDVELTP